MVGPFSRWLAPGAVLAVAAALGGWAVACGLPLSGLAPADAEGGAGDDATQGADGTATAGDDGPSSCATVDAACLGGMPSGWQPVTVTDGGCPAAFTAATLRTNPRVADGGCACGACQVVGSFACTNGVAVSGGDGCNDPTLVTALPDTCTTAQAQHVEAHPVGAGGVVGCFAANDAGAGAASDPLTVCYPGCDADFCGAAAARCIAADGDVTCPSGFTLLARAGTGVDPGCAPCACDAGPPGPCGGTVTVFDDPACGDSGSSATYAVGTCNQFSTDYQSLVVHLVPPDASCTVASAAVEGDASLVGVRTICCR